MFSAVYLSSYSLSLPFFIIEEKKLLGEPGGQLTDVNLVPVQALLFPYRLNITYRIYILSADPVKVAIWRPRHRRYLT